MKALSVLGSTGSIGTQTLELAEEFPDRFRVVALTAGNNLDLLVSQIQRHAPEVVAEIERTVRAAAPYPVPLRLGRVTYTDTWLWDKSGNFQLDTLTEGQD